MRDDFCILILSHDRAGNIPTLNTLKRQGYTGEWYIVVDHPDDREPYIDEYGDDNVVYFDKDECLPEMDRGDNFDRRNSILYARYYSFQIARDLGYTYFMQLDDDYEKLEYRFNSNGEFGHWGDVNMDLYIDAAIKYLDDAGLDTFAAAQGGDFIGGEGSAICNGVGDITAKRKAMNTFISRSDNQFDFRGSINEDVNTYTRAQQYGKLFLTNNIISMEQERTQQGEGGLSDLYDEEGTYIKSFYTLLYSPSSVSLSKMGESHQRIHHKVSWRNTVPKLVPESVKDGD